MSTLEAAGISETGQDAGAPGGALPTDPGAALTNHAAHISSGGAHDLQQGVEWDATRAPRKRVRNAFRVGVFRRCGALCSPVSTASVTCAVMASCN